MNKILLMGFLLGLVLSVGKGYTSPSLEAEAELYDHYMDLVNNHRVGMGLNPLTYSVVMEEIAEEHSSNMAKKMVEFGHLGFSERCQKVRDAFGRGSKCGEIVATGQKTAAKVFEAWLNSPAHRSTMEGAYTHTGVGMRMDKSGRLYWTQVFNRL